MNKKQSFQVYSIFILLAVFIGVFCAQYIGINFIGFILLFGFFAFLIWVFRKHENIGEEANLYCQSNWTTLKNRIQQDNDLNETVLFVDILTRMNQFEQSLKGNPERRFGYVNAFIDLNNYINLDIDSQGDSLHTISRFFTDFINNAPHGSLEHMIKLDKLFKISAARERQTPAGKKINK